MHRDYYIVLGINRGADAQKIKKAYRTVVKKYHPDVAHTREGKERFLEIREAYETLTDEKKRKKYDEELARQGPSLRITKVPDIVESRASIFSEMDALYSSVDDFFSGFLPGFFDHEKRMGKDLYFEIILTPGEASQGGLFPVTIPVIESCPRCHKAGFWEDFLCPVCSGYGRVRSEREFSISIPPRVKHGTEIRLSLEDIGLKDSYVNIAVFVDPHFDVDQW